MQHVELPLTNGALLIMEGASQADWQVCHLAIINPFQTNGIFYTAAYNKVRMVHCVY